MRCNPLQVFPYVHLWVIISNSVSSSASVSVVAPRLAHTPHKPHPPPATGKLRFRLEKALFNRHTPIAHPGSKACQATTKSLSSRIHKTACNFLISHQHIYSAFIIQSYSAIIIHFTSFSPFVILYNSYIHAKPQYRIVCLIPSR